jgi:hypothetical protein
MLYFRFFSCIEKLFFSFIALLGLSGIFQMPCFASQQNKSFDTKKIKSIEIDYKDSCSELCLIGAYYDTDKSSQRRNVTGSRHSHPYTLFYDSIFQEKKDSELSIAELGILEGASILMWREYFKKAHIYGYEYDLGLINSFKSKFNNERITLREMNVRSREQIRGALESTGIQYDLIIEDTTHQFEDQIRVIENIYPYVKNGGMLIIEDIFKSYKEQDYIDRLQPILSLFQDCYFVSMDHKNRYSIGWDNDKILVLVKGGADPIFKDGKNSKKSFAD